MHRKLQTAKECLKADRVGCKRQGGYSDRGIYRIKSNDDLEAVLRGQGKRVDWDDEE